MKEYLLMFALLLWVRTVPKFGINGQSVSKPYNSDISVCLLQLIVLILISLCLNLTSYTFVT